MKTAFYKIAEQIGNSSFYGEVDLEFVITTNYEELVLSIDDAFALWHPGVLFGARYFLEHSFERIGLRINVKYIKFKEVDTTNTIIAYLVYNALLNATELNVQNSKIKFDENIRSFIFSK
ncbi:MAG: hypothetical protein J0I41_04355 [Filimonas sp.]|nr:hypothetical protein [Filimonas sp.]